MESTPLTRSLSKVKSKISSKFRANDGGDDEAHTLKVMKYDDTYSINSTLSNLEQTALAAGSASLPPALSTASSSSTVATMSSNTSQESRSSSVTQLEPIPEDPLVINIPQHSRSISQSSTNSIATSSPMDHQTLLSMQSSRKTSLDDKQDDQLMEQLLPPPPAISSPQITTEMSSPFNFEPLNGQGQLQTPLEKPRSCSVACDPLAVLDTRLSVPLVSEPQEPTVSHPNDFADAVALSILNQVDGNTNESDWKI